MSLAGTPRPIQRPLPLREAVYDALTELIITGVLKPGQHLVEVELAAHLGVSRQPIREALHRLQAEGWVDLRPGQGAFVHVPTENEVDQLMAVRILLETESARLAAAAASPDHIAHLRSLLDEGTAAVKADDIGTVVRTNAALHAYVSSMAGNVVLAELVALVDARMRWYYTPIARDRGQAAWDEHKELVDALEAGDHDRAAAVMTSHIEQTRRTHHDHATHGSP